MNIDFSIKNEVIEDLENELTISDPKFNKALLISKASAVVREVVKSRNYPKTYSTEMIEIDLENFYSNIRALTLYDYNKIGIDGEDSHSESGVSSSFTKRSQLFSGIVPISRT